MNQAEAYIFLLKDTIFSNLIFTAHTELALEVMNMLASYQEIYILSFSSVGALISIICNYIFGVILYTIYKISKNTKIHARYDRLKDFYLKYGSYFLFLTFIPNVGKFIPLIAGFTRHGIIRSILYAFLSKFVYYIFIIFY